MTIFSSKQSTFIFKKTKIIKFTEQMCWSKIFSPKIAILNIAIQ